MATGNSATHWAVGDLVASPMNPVGSGTQRLAEESEVQPEGLPKLPAPYSASPILPLPFYNF